MEPTGHYWLNLAAYLRACDVPVVLVNPFHVKQTKEFVDNSPTKNDRKDALVIGKLIKDGHFVIPTWPQGDFAELRGLVHLRYQLMKNLQRLHARIRRWLDQYFPEFLDVFPDWEAKRPSCRFVSSRFRKMCVRIRPRSWFACGENTGYSGPWDFRALVPCAQAPSVPSV
ncbi:hypothetical protein GCM10007043_23560 [Calditerricola satsumensis]|uniref:Transposase IS110-like N-terminal domain-containing protein n=1 Tax=Calditerricola satsumensis TaxID=373054 RepID=A0A8J3BGG6_9BACI|nr:hypothetical protein GCM10007043_23560 [Calditerricola satsumensis]